jgi:hypothetical protein
MRIEFNRNTRFILYHVHNQRLDGQVVLVWWDGRTYSFSFHDEPAGLSGGRDWVCIGELEWRVEGDHFVHELMPLQHRSERELEERAKRTKRHREYRKRLWERYRLEGRLRDLG